MHDPISFLVEHRLSLRQAGFTLIELMIVVAIIGILAAIAIPQFSSYRQQAFNAAAESNLRNIITAEETYFVDNNYSYLAVAATQGPGPAGALPSTTASSGVGLVVGAFLAPNPSNYVAFTGHSLGTRVYAADSAIGPQWRSVAPGLNPSTVAQGGATNALLGAGWNPL